MSSTGAVVAQPPFIPRPQPSNPGPRPKLSLNTSCPNNLGKKSTSLNLDTLSAVSPTARNTHKNAFEPPTVPSTPLKLVQPLIIPSRELSATLPTPSTPLSISSSYQERTPSTSSTSSTDSSPYTPRVPYAVSATTRSILTNSPLPKPQTPFVRSATARTSRVFFPPTKRVTFSAQLTEEIRTLTYTLAHSDVIRSRTPSPDSMCVSSPDKHGRGSDDEDSEEADEGDSSGAQTPMAGRRKRRRWVWTLGPIDGVRPPCAEPDLESEDEAVKSDEQ